MKEVAPEDISIPELLCRPVTPEDWIKPQRGVMKGTEGRTVRERKGPMSIPEREKILGVFMKT